MGIENAPESPGPAPAPPAPQPQLEEAGREATLLSGPAAAHAAARALGPPPPLSPEQIVALQRTAGNRLVTRYLQDAGHAGAQPRWTPALRVLDRVRLARVATWGGNWTTTKYKQNPPAPAVPQGVEIGIDFMPNRHVNAKKIGIVQTAMSQSGGVAPFANAADFPDNATRNVPKGPDAGLGIDQLENFKNPLYPTKAGTSADTLGSTPLIPLGDPGGGRHGWRFVEGGKVKRESAMIEDRTRLPVANDSRQIFETTALAIEGEQVGTYYGSVQWGWQRDGAGKWTQLPFKLKAWGTPSSRFTRAGNLWNRNRARVHLPLASGRWVNVAASPLVQDPGATLVKELAKLDVKNSVMVTNKGAGRPFNAGPDKWWKTTVTSGARIGMVGWVLSSNLSVKKPR